MNTTTIASLEQEIQKVQEALRALGPMHPGNISSQYQVCGHPGCRCADAVDPKRHGPYHKLTYVYRGKSVCRFVRAGTEGPLKHRLAVYKQFRALTDRWIALSIQRGLLEFFPPARPKAKPKAQPPRHPPRS